MENDPYFFELNARIAMEKLLWIQGPGGNTSYKKDDILYIKPSGARIHEIKEVDQLAKLRISGFVRELSLLGLEPESEQGYKKAIDENNLSGPLRPSMESGFHACLPTKYVFHFHSLGAILLAQVAAKQKPSAFKQWCLDKYSSSIGTVELIPPCLPGLELTRYISKNKNAPVYLLENHGVVLAFDNADFIDQYKVFEQDALKTFLPAASSLLESWAHQSAHQLCSTSPELLKANLRFYFPDMAILYPRIRPHLEQVPSGESIFQCKSTGPDLDALENWLASSMLERLNPSLDELPSNLYAAIPNLPTEVARKKIMETKS